MPTIREEDVGIPKILPISFTASLSLAVGFIWVAHCCPLD